MLCRRQSYDVRGPGAAAVRGAGLTLPRQAFEDVIDGVEMDLDRQRYADVRRSARQYCRRVASAVGMICIRIWDCTQRRARLTCAENLGIALQLTNILRDVRTDLASAAGSTCRSRTCRRSAARLTIFVEKP